MLSSAVPRILMAGTHAGVGKSLVVLGLVVALRKRGVSVSCCVTGEALPQALVYSRITRRYARVLDSGLLDPEQLHAAICQASLGAEVVIIDGHGGLITRFPIIPGAAGSPLSSTTDAVIPGKGFPIEPGLIGRQG